MRCLTLKYVTDERYIKSFCGRKYIFRKFQPHKFPTASSTPDIRVQETPANILRRTINFTKLGEVPQNAKN